MTKKEDIFIYVISVAIWSGLFGRTIYKMYIENRLTLWEVTYCSVTIFIIINLFAICAHRMMNNPNTR